MIRYLKRNQIDDVKYNNCIQISINSRIYAYSWYLDIVADNWGVLILNDYEAVMPLPWRSKYFIKYIYPPAWTQQLGVFSSNEISENLVLKFIKSIPRKFKKITIQFNSGNKLNLVNSEKRVNYILPLNKPYEDLLNGFNDNRKRDLKKALKSEVLIDKEIDPNDFLNFYLPLEKNYKLNFNQISTLESLLHNDLTNINIWGIRKNNKLVAGLVWLIDDTRITYLLPILSTELENTGISTLFLSKLIEQYSNSNYMLDFEGSMIAGVAEYYKSFGSKIEPYFLYKKVSI